MEIKKRNVLLLEPNYKNKYPPIGLMKLATYHRMLGDNVVFYKGDLKSFIVNNLVCELIQKLSEVDESVAWGLHIDKLTNLIRTGKKEYFEYLIELSKYELLVTDWLIFYKDFYRKKKYIDTPIWDRICITTLFTFHWKITIETIEFAKHLVKDIKDLHVGGILSTLLSDELFEETGVKSHKGLLSTSGILDKNDIVIDSLPLDYSILNEIDYEYPESGAYYGYMTRGCVNKCSFCAVPILEPTFNHLITLKDKIAKTSNKFGEQRNLLLLDNNVLASKDFDKIIEEIKSSGFQKGAKYVDPNYLDISIRNLEDGVNDRAYIRKTYNLLQVLLNKLKGENQQFVYDLLDEWDLLSLHTVSKENLLAIYPHVKELFERYRNKLSKNRYVDFNQGLDARLLTDEKMELLSQIAIKPLRIAFDSLKFEKVYVKAIRSAAKYGIRNLSNYLLFNEKDTPEDLYKRLEINVLLCEELDVSIHSFPMKFHPIGKVDGVEWYKNRDYTGKHWNRKTIRAVQTILNATKGKIGKGKSFFYQAFGKDVNEFLELLYMPEVYILHRLFFEHIGRTEKWRTEFRSLNPSEVEETIKVIASNRFKGLNGFSSNLKIRQIVEDHYVVSRESVSKPSSMFYEEKIKYDELKNKV